MSQNINDLRKTLFETLQGVKDGSVSVDNARAVANLSQQIINTAKIEIDYMNAGGKVTSEFIEINQRNQIGSPAQHTVAAQLRRLKG